MNFFESIFGKKSNDTSNLEWNILSDISQLDTILENSIIKTQVIFKHSTRCGISSSVLKRFERQFDSSNPVELHFLDLFQHRDISNEIAHRFNVEHQSPQILIIKNRKMVYDASHYDIVGIDIVEFT